MNEAVRDSHAWLVPLLAAIAILLYLAVGAGKPGVRDNSAGYGRPVALERRNPERNPSISDGTVPLGAIRAREMLAQAFSGLDFKRGVTVRLGAGAPAAGRLRAKDVDGVRCSRLDSGSGSAAISILRNADGYWFIAHGEAIQANFLERHLSRTLDGVAGDIASDSNAHEDGYRIGIRTGPDGANVRKIVRNYSPERRALAASAVGKLKLPAGPNGLADAIQRKIPTQTVYYLAAGANTLVAQFQLNSAGEPVGLGVTYEAPGSAGIDDGAFRVPPGLPSRIAQDSGELARLLTQGAIPGRP